MKVVKVDGEEVRKNHYADFVMGGNPSRYPFIPKDEVWVEEVSDPRTMALATVHELAEHKLMQDGKTYDEAHDICLALETKLRGGDPLSHEEATQDKIKSAAITLDIEKGDTLLGGRFKNVKHTVKTIGTDSNGQPTVNGMKLLSFRIEKKMKPGEAGSMPWDTVKASAYSKGFQDVMEKKAQLLTAGMGFGMHKGIERVLNYFMRENPATRQYFDNHYQGLANEGYTSGLKNEGQILPRYRRMWGMLYPSATGLMDYEFARVLGDEHRRKGLSLLDGRVEPSVNSGDPKAILGSQGITGKDFKTMKSPIMRNVLTGVAENTQPGLALKILLKTKGEDKQLLTGTGKVLADFMTGSLMHGGNPVFGLGTALAGAPDALIGSLASNDTMTPVLAAKSKLIEKGKGMGPWGRQGLYALNPSLGELTSVGSDIGTMKSHAKPAMRILGDSLDDTFKTHSTMPPVVPAAKGYAKSLLENFKTLVKGVKR